MFFEMGHLLGISFLFGPDNVGPMLPHFFSLFGRAMSMFFNDIGSTLLGRLLDLAFASSLAVAILLKTKKEHGWRAMLNHWRKEYRGAIKFSLLAAGAVYGPLIAWCFVRTVYLDHMTLVQSIAEKRGVIAKTNQTLQETRGSLNSQISDLRSDCSRLDGANKVLDRQNKDQQNTINNCQSQAINLLKPKPFGWHAIALEKAEEMPTESRSRWLLLANKDISPPLEFRFSCTPSIVSAEVKVVGTAADVRTTKLNEQVWGFQLRSPAWGPDSPILVNTITAKTAETKCEFHKDTVTE